MPGIDYGDNLYGPIKFGNMQLVTIQATTDGAGAVTIDAANSSPGTTITGGAAGLATIGFPTGQNVHPLNILVQKADSVGEIGTFRTLVAGTGVGTLEFWPSNTAGTATAVLNARIYISFLVGSF
jgi:hypothetical protein